MTTRLDGQTAIVTGGARGIGRAIGARLAAEGARVITWDLDASTAGRTDRFQPALAQRVDVTSTTSIANAHAEALARFGSIEILVNNAGINGPVAEVTDYPLEAWDRVLAVDLTGVFYCCRAIVPQMRERGYGRIVNVASIAGKEGTPGVAAYCAAKAGVIGFGKALARELATTGITVNSVTPVMAETELLRQMTPEHIALTKAKIPMGRFVAVEEIAAMVAWIASPDCSFTTGGVFDISGGRANY
jgi:2-dehydro-3-deoxy-L-rhamnonate dehydrogenase (NAD+)